MSETVNPETMNTLDQAVPSRQATTPPAVARRPAMVTFAAIMLFVLGGFELTWAIVQFANASWIASNVYGTFGNNLWLWGIVDTILALIAFYVGYDILQGGTFGQVFGIIIAGFDAFRWFFYMPAIPWMGAVMIAVDILIIYGLVAHSDYFDATVID